MKRLKCLKCKSGILEKVNGTEPYNQDYLQCNNCDSTFNIIEFEDKIKKMDSKLIIEGQEIILENFSFNQYRLINPEYNNNTNEIEYIPSGKMIGILFNNVPNELKEDIEILLNNYCKKV